MTQIINERYTYNNPPHWACAAVTDWQVFNDGQRISVAELVEKANQQEAHIQTLLAEIQLLKESANRPNTVEYISGATSFSPN